jgi:hypothetical protein
VWVNRLINLHVNEAALIKAWRLPESNMSSSSGNACAPAAPAGVSAAVAPVEGNRTNPVSLTTPVAPSFGDLEALAGGNVVPFTGGNPNVTPKQAIAFLLQQPMFWQHLADGKHYRFKIYPQEAIHVARGEQGRRNKSLPSSGTGPSSVEAGQYWF